MGGTGTILEISCTSAERVSIGVSESISEILGSGVEAAFVGPVFSGSSLSAIFEVLALGVPYFLFGSFFLFSASLESRSYFSLIFVASLVLSLIFFCLAFLVSFA